jgi:hypothetical protein
VGRRDPKRIQRGLGMTQSSQKYLRKLKMASADKEREKKIKVLETQKNWHHCEEHITSSPTT